MIVGIAQLLILGLIVDWAFRKIKVPGLVGMLFLGLLLGPHLSSLISPELISVSEDFRLFALIVILLRVGFELSKDSLKLVALRVVLMATLPAITQGITVMFLGGPLLGLSLLESAILGAVLAATSPAVVIPMMIRFKEKNLGVIKGIPSMIMLAVSLEDVFVIVVYSVLISSYLGDSTNLIIQLIGIPFSIILGTLIGLISGLILFKLFKNFKMRSTKQVLILLGLSILLVQVEYLLKPWVSFAALLSIIAIGFLILQKDQSMATKISLKISKLWIFAEIFLFTLVGAQVNIEVVFQAGLTGAAVIFLGLIARSFVTYLCLLKSNLNVSERFFVVISYLPKATVQAAIGGAPLAAMTLRGMETGPGEIILAVAVLSIILTAPLGAVAIKIVGKKVLKAESSDFQDGINKVERPDY